MRSLKTLECFGPKWDLCKTWEIEEEIKLFFRGHCVRSLLASSFLAKIQVLELELFQKDKLVLKLSLYHFNL